MARTSTFADIHADNVVSGKRTRTPAQRSAPLPTMASTNTKSTSTRASRKPKATSGKTTSRVTKREPKNKQAASAKAAPKTKKPAPSIPSPTAPTKKRKQTASKAKPNKRVQSVRGGGLLPNEHPEESGEDEEQDEEMIDAHPPAKKIAKATGHARATRARSRAKDEEANSNQASATGAGVAAATEDEKEDNEEDPDANAEPAMDNEHIGAAEVQQEDDGAVDEEGKNEVEDEADIEGDVPVDGEDDRDDAEDLVSGNQDTIAVAEGLAAVDVESMGAAESGGPQQVKNSHGEISHSPELTSEQDEIGASVDPAKDEEAAAAQTKQDEAEQEQSEQHQQTEIEPDRDTALPHEEFGLEDFAPQDSGESAPQWESTGQDMASSNLLHRPSEANASSDSQWQESTKPIDENAGTQDIDNVSSGRENESLPLQQNASADDQVNHTNQFDSTSLLVHPIPQASAADDTTGIDSTSHLVNGIWQAFAADNSTLIIPAEDAPALAQQPADPEHSLAGNAPSQERITDQETFERQEVQVPVIRIDQTYVTEQDDVTAVGDIAEMADLTQVTSLTEMTDLYDEDDTNLGMGDNTLAGFGEVGLEAEDCDNTQEGLQFLARGDYANRGRDALARYVEEEEDSLSYEEEESQLSNQRMQSLGQIHYPGEGIDGVGPHRFSGLSTVRTIDENYAESSDEPLAGEVEHVQDEQAQNEDDEAEQNESDREEGFEDDPSDNESDDEFDAMNRELAESLEPDSGSEPELSDLEDEEGATEDLDKDQDAGQQDTPSMNHGLEEYAEQFGGDPNAALEDDSAAVLPDETTVASLQLREVQQQATSIYDEPDRRFSNDSLQTFLDTYGGDQLDDDHTSSLRNGLVPQTHAPTHQNTSSSLPPFPETSSIMQSNNKRKRASGTQSDPELIEDDPQTPAPRIKRSESSSPAEDSSLFAPSMGGTPWPVVNSANKATATMTRTPANNLDIAETTEIDDSDSLVMTGARPINRSPAAQRAFLARNGDRHRSWNTSTTEQVPAPPLDEEQLSHIEDVMRNRSKGPSPEGR